MGNNVSAIPRAQVGEVALYDSNMLSLIRRTVAKDCNNDEFDIFIAMCRALRADPLRKQAYAFVYNKNDAEKRQLTLVTAISLLRAIADRTGNYRPDEEAPELHYDKDLISPSNPLGFVKAVVRVWKFSHGAWHKVTAEAYWDEYAPIKESEDAFNWVDTGEFWLNKDGSPSNRPKKRKVRREGTFEAVLDTSGRWGKNPRGMLPKCAEALALRKAWPDELSNVTSEEEIDRAQLLDVSPAEIAAAGETNRRLEKIGGSSGLMVDWLKGEMAPIEMVPVGVFADRAMEFISANRSEPSQINLWQARNRHSLKEFWARAPSDALEIKKAIETALTPSLEAP